MREILIFTLIAFALSLMSCEELCEDCYTYKYSDGTEEWMCVEYECDDEYFYY